MKPLEKVKYVWVLLQRYHAWLRKCLSCKLMETGCSAELWPCLSAALLLYSSQSIIRRSGAALELLPREQWDHCHGCVQSRGDVALGNTGCCQLGWVGVGFGDLRALSQTAWLCDQPQLPMKVQCWVGLGGAVSCVLLGVVFGGTEAVVKSRMWVHCKAWQCMNVNNTVGKCSGNPSSVWQECLSKFLYSRNIQIMANL